MENSPERKFKIGDTVFFKRDPEVIREIVDYDGSGYVWKYPGNDNEFTSLNSTDTGMIYWEVLNK